MDDSVLVSWPHIQNLNLCMPFHIILPSYLGDLGNRILRTDTVFRVIIGSHIQFFISAGNAVGLFLSELNLLELTLPSIECQQPSLQRTLPLNHKLDGFNGKDHTDQARQHSKYSQSRASAQTHLIIAPQASVAKAVSSVAGYLRLPANAGSTQQLPIIFHAMVVDYIPACGVI